MKYYVNHNKKIKLYPFELCFFVLFVKQGKIYQVCNKNAPVWVTPKVGGISKIYEMQSDI